jgi:protein-disulfide isomerase
MIVGAAQRNNRRQKQKQSASAARVVAAASGRRTGVAKIVVPVVIIVVIAAAVIGGVLYEQQKSAQAAQTIVPALTVQGSNQYPVTLDKATATVLAGKPTAKITIDAYEDFLCPICGQFESANFTNIEKQLQAGTVQVRYHMINLLDASSVPAGYSMMAANTALAVAAAAPDKFMDFHYSLYQKQPAENGPGWTQAQLTSVANRLGVTGSTFDNIVNNKTYDNQINANLNAAETNQALVQTNSDGSKGFGTPTIVANGAVVNWQTNPTWLATLVKASYPNS